jgi:hypothetical protein
MKNTNHGKEKWNKDFADPAPFALCLLSGAWKIVQTIQNLRK